LILPDLHDSARQLQHMVIYNVTIKVEWSIHEHWLRWMKDVHIPEVLGTEMFYKYQLVRLLEVDDTDGPTFAVQYYAKNLADYNFYIKEFSSSLRQKSYDKWGNKFVAFRSAMEVVH